MKFILVEHVLMNIVLSSHFKMPLTFRQQFAYTRAAWWPALSMEVLTFLLMLGKWKRQGECQVGRCCLGTNFQVMQGYHVGVRTLDVSLLAGWVCVELEGSWGGILGAQRMLRLCQYSMRNNNAKSMFWWWKSFLLTVFPKCMNSFSVYKQSRFLNFSSFLSTPVILG
jgi:hypothetical protein